MLGLIRGSVPLLSLLSVLPQVHQPHQECPPSPLEFDVHRMFNVRQTLPDPTNPLAEYLFHRLPGEIFNAIIGYLPLERSRAAAFTRDAYKGAFAQKNCNVAIVSPWSESVSRVLHPARKRQALLYQAAAYLRIGPCRNPGTREVRLDQRTTAVFLILGRWSYLHDLCGDDAQLHPMQDGFNVVKLGLKKTTQIALRVTEFGILDIAFEVEHRQQKLSWIILGVFCLLPPCIFLYRIWGDHIISSVTHGQIPDCTAKSKRMALIAGIVVNIALIVAIIVPVVVAVALGVA